MKASVRKAATPRRRTAPRSNERRLVTQHPRRRILSLAAGAAALPAVSRIAWGQSYPARPVRLVVGFPAGGAADIGARLIAQWLSERLGQQFFIENRPGAGSNIATEAVARAPADGYTLLWTTSANAVNATLYDKLNFDFIRDITPVASIMRLPLVMLVHPSFPARSVPEFIAYGKANPGKVNMASPGTGTAIHLSSELFKMMTGIDMVHVPYRDLPYSDLIGGRVEVYFGAVLSAIAYIKSGNLRALAVTTATRSELLPDIPTVAEFVPSYEASAFFGIGAPKSTPTESETIERLNKEVNAALADPRVKARLADLGGDALVLSSADFRKLIADETEKWGKVIRAANIKTE